MRILLILAAFLLSGCRVWLTADADYDDLYFQRYVRPGYVYRDYWSPVNPYYQPNYFYYTPRTFYNRPNVIIIKPEVKPTVPAKRPTREGGQHNPNFTPQRGRRQ